MNTFPLEEKVVLLTGGLGGIALGVARLVLERGGKVFLADLQEEAEGLEVARREAAKVGTKAQGKEDSVGYARLDVTDRQQFEGERLSSSTRRTGLGL